MPPTRPMNGVLLPPPQRGGRPKPPVALPMRSNAYRVLSNEFIAELHEDFRAHGREALAACRQDYPHIYLQVMARLAQVHPVEVGIPGEFAQAMTREQLLDKVGERLGETYRQMFGDFISRLDRLDADAESAAGRAWKRKPPLARPGR